MNLKSGDPLWDQMRYKGGLLAVDRLRRDRMTDAETLAVAVAALRSLERSDYDRLADRLELVPVVEPSIVREVSDVPERRGRGGVTRLRGVFVDAGARDDEVAWRFGLVEDGVDGGAAACLVGGFGVGRECVDSADEGGGDDDADRAFLVAALDGVAPAVAHVVAADLLDLSRPADAFPFGHGPDCTPRGVVVSERVPRGRGRR